MRQIAPRVAGWERRLGGFVGAPSASPGGGGDGPSRPVLVELFVDGSWQDITTRVMVRDGSERITISQGQPNEASGTDPGRCSFQLNNRDGLFSPRNPVSPYYGKIGRNTQLRVSVQDGFDKAYRFWGEVPAWPQVWDPTGRDVWVPMGAAGVLRRLGQGESPLGSAMFVALGLGEATNTVIGYWPCEDPVGAMAIGSAATGMPQLTIVGTPTLASFTGFVCSNPLPVLADAMFTATIPAYDHPPFGVANPFATIVRFLLALPSAGETDQVLVSFTWTGSIPRWEVYYSSAAGGKVGFRGVSAGGVTIVDTGVGGTDLNGALVHVSVDLSEQGGIALTAQLSIQKVGEGSATLLTDIELGASIGLVTSLTVAPARTLTDTTIGHVSLQLADNQPTDVTELADILDAHAGETAGARIQRLCGIASLTFEAIGAVASTARMGAQLNATLLALINDAVLVDGGLLYELTTALGLGYRSRVSLENQSPTLALSYPGNNLSEVPTPVDDDRATRNDITVSRPGGSKGARAVLTEGALSIQAPPNGVGRYDEALSRNVELDSDLPDQAGWRLHLGTVDEARYPQLAINMAHPSFTADPSLREQVLALRLGDRLTVADPPAWLPPDAISQLALGTVEVIDQFQHRVMYNCVPESPYRTASAEAAVGGRADTAGSSLAVGVSSTDTAFSVATTSGPTWITTLSESPFDVRLGGEVVTVAAVGTLINSNPFFTTDLTGWTDAGQNSTISRSTAVVNSDRGAVASMLIVPNGIGASGGGASTPLSAVGTITAGASYRVSLWAYSPAGWPDLRPAVDWYDAAGVFISSGLGSGTSVAAGVWTYIEQTLVAPALASRVVVRARHGGTPAVTDVWYAWAIRLVAVASVTSVSPQAMTVVRSVNGVVKSQAAGEDIRLDQPAVTGL